MPAAFCVDGSCSKWKAGHPIGPEGYPATMDGLTDVYVKRQITEKPPAYLVYSFPLASEELSNSKIIVNETHVQIPLYDMLKAGYSRTYDVADECATLTSLTLLHHAPRRAS